MWQRILIASAGEAAARIARTCKRLGTTAITVVTAPGEQGVHTEACDDVVVVRVDEDGAIDPQSLAEAARACRADVVHLGYAAPRRHLALARALATASIPWVGASLEALEKSLDREALREAADEVTFTRWVPGPTRGFAKLADAIEAANALGYPVVLRAAAHDTDVAPQAIDDDDELMSAWDPAAAAAREAGTHLTVEKFFERARTFDVLVASDAEGETLALCEVETTLADHDGLLIEESPSPDIANRADGEAMRFSMFETAIRVVSPLGLPGISTVRLLLDADSHLHVSSVRAGLPRHHTTVEMVTGLDLVALDLALAQGAPMPDEVHTLQPSGHAFFATVRTTDRAATQVREFRFPPAPQRKVRFEPSVQDGCPPPLADAGVLCRIGTYAPIRHQALLTLDRMLAEVDIAPLRTNQKQLRAILADESYRAGQYDGAFLGRIRPA